MAKSYAVTFLGGPKDPTSVFVVPGVALDRAEDLELPKGKAVEVPKTVLEKVRTIANRVQYRHTLDFDFDEDYEAPKPAPVRRGPAEEKVTTSRGINEPLVEAAEEEGEEPAVALAETAPMTGAAVAFDPEPDTEPEDDTETDR
jgi:hypothetical protein